MAASASALISIEEYLHTSYRPDCDFVDGQLEERNVGDTRHSLLQMWLGYWFISHQKEWKTRVLSELRTRVSENRVRLPDVAVVTDDEGLQESPRTSPLLVAIEILSPDDRIPRVTDRLRDFLAMGVANIWLLDPADRCAYTFTHEGLRLIEAARLEVPNSPIYLDLTQLFAALDPL